MDNINKVPVSLRGILSKDSSDISNNSNVNAPEITEGLNYDGEIGDIYKLWIKNFFLNILTLGIYQFWGKTSLRNYIVGSYELAKHRFEYRGTGGELFRGFIKSSAYTLLITIIIGIPLFALYAHFFKITPTVSTGVKFISHVLPVLFFPFIFAAIYKSYKYKISRVAWKGIRGRLEGSLIKFLLMAFFLRHGLNLLTLGLLSPILRRMEYRYIIQNLYIGNTKFTFDDSTQKEGFNKIIFTNLITLILTIPTLGLSRKWYHAKLLNYLSQCTKINNVSFKTTFELSELFRLKIKNFFIIIFTLGFGHPIILNNNAGFFADNFYVIGNLNNLELLQSKVNVGATGEEFVDEMHLSEDLGF